MSQIEEVHTNIYHQLYSVSQIYYPIYTVSVASQVQHLLLIFLWEEKKSFTLFIEFVAEILISLQEHTCKSPQTGL